MRKGKDGTKRKNEKIGGENGRARKKSEKKEYFIYSHLSCVM
jgi:hypothetical protein